MARLRSDSSSQAVAAKAKAPAKAPGTRQALKEKTNTTRAKAPVYSDDGNTEGLVKDAKPKLKPGRPKKSRQHAHDDGDDLVMAGGLGLISDKNAGQTQTSEAPMTTDELAKSDGAPLELEPRKPTRRPPPPRTTRKVVHSQASSEILEGLKKRAEAAAKGQKAKLKTTAVVSGAGAVAISSSSDPLPTKSSKRESANALGERSDLSLTPSPPPPGKLSAVKGNRTSIIQPGSVLKQPGSVMKTHNTPLVESSILALKNFKRRPRQPSMLQMVQQRAASARPSLSNVTILTVDDNAVEESSDFDLDLGGEDEDDFSPEAEGTPLNTGKFVQPATESPKDKTTVQATKSNIDHSSSSVRKRKSDQADVSSGSLSALRAKRQKTTIDSFVEVHDHEPATNADDDEIVIRSSTERAETPQPALTSDVQVINSSSTSTPSTEAPSSRHRQLPIGDSFVIPSTEHEEEDDEPDVEVEDDEVPSATMADPLSSSPVPDKVRHNTFEDDFMRPPATQLSPEPVKRKPRGKVKPMNTATLQSLLPKRRRPLIPRRRKSEFDFEESDDDDPDVPLEASHLDDDEDELGGRLRRGRKVATTNTGKSKSAKATHTTAKKAAPRKKSTARTTSKKTQKTYSRRIDDSDKENDGSDFEESDESTLPEISVSMEEVAKSKEIEAAKAKFADIDTWDMDFESMSAEDHRSSSLSWR